MFAVALMLSLALLISSISASAAFREGFYGDYYYELVGTCEDGEAYARTSVTNRSYTTKVSAEIYRYTTGPLYTNIGPLEGAGSVSFNIPMSLSSFRMWSHPVSYTHLDVYKRQMQRSSIPRSVSPSWPSSATGPPPPSLTPLSGQTNPPMVRTF